MRAFIYLFIHLFIYSWKKFTPPRFLFSAPLPSCLLFFRMISKPSQLFRPLSLLDPTVKQSRQQLGPSEGVEFFLFVFTSYRKPEHGGISSWMLPQDTNQPILARSAYHQRLLHLLNHDLVMLQWCTNSTDKIRTNTR